MKIALGIYGFVRIDIFKNEWLKILELFKDKDIIIDFYICTPTIIGEFDNSEVNFEYIKNTLLKNKIVNNVFIKEYEYNSNKFIKRSKELNYEFKTSDNLYPYRILSLFYSISNVSKEIIESNVEYDFIILTRFDMLNLINSIGNDINKYREKSSMYILACNYTGAEDRFIISQKEGLIKLSNFYETYNDIINKNTKLISEYMLYDYLNHYNNEIKLYQQSDIIMDRVDISIKYTEDFRIKCCKIYNDEK
jgi:hypothetical protein